MPDAFDDAIDRLHNASRAAHAAFQDADAALTLELDAMRQVTREKGSLSETIARLEALILSQGSELREMRSQLTAARSEIGELRQRRDRNGGA